jgi:ribonuclease-3
MTPYATLIENVHILEARLGCKFKDPKTIALAFVHRSFVNENKDISEHNERLEFLGDSVLGLVISDYLYRNLPDVPEGDLSYLRSRLVEASSCMQYLMKLGVEGNILLGKGEKMNEGRGRDSIYADLFEAIVGAIYVDSGLKAAEQFIIHNFEAEIKEILKTPQQNFKAMLQDWCQKKYQQTPFYEVIEEYGPDHSKMFAIRVLVKGEEMGRGNGSSKKIAQQAAAEQAMQRISSWS